MKSVYGGLLCVAGVLSLCAVAEAQNARLFLDPPEAIINPGDLITLEVWVDDVPFPPGLRAYQAQVVISGGASGTLVLADPTPLPPNWALFVDVMRPDYVFYGPPNNVAVTPPFLRLAAFRTTAAGDAVPDPRYCGTYIFRATDDADGVFNVDFTDSVNTYLRGPSSPAENIPVDTFGATITVTIAPPNDDCANSIAITDGVRPFSTIFGTVDGPALPPWCDEGSGTVFEADSWFDYQATCTGPLTVTTCDDADFDTRLAIYSDGSGTCSCPSDNSTLLACSDDGEGCSGSTSEMVLPVTVGECYTIRVGGGAGQTGMGNLTVVCIGNDECATAEPLTVPSTVVGSTDNANLDDLVAPSCGPAIDSWGVWYRVVGAGDHVMTASLCGGASYDSRLSVFRGPTCATLSCVADANDTCGSQETVAWCSQLGEQYWILVHGVGNASGTFTLEVDVDDCDDTDECTNDGCIAAECVNQPNYDVDQECCDPATGGTALIEDENQCTFGVCDPDTGEVTQIPVDDGLNVECDDELDCTVDECLSGECANTDINTIPCQDSTECPGETSCDDIAGLCVCVEAPTLSFVPEPGSLPVGTCYQPGEQITIRLEMGFSPTRIKAGEFYMEYDTSTLLYVGMEAGGLVDPTSPFTFQIGEQFDPIAGTIDYAVGVPLKHPGTIEPATLAVLTLEAYAECDPFVRLRLHEPPTRLINDAYEKYEWPGRLIVEELPPISTDASPPVITACPADITVNPDPGELFAVVEWDDPTADDSCDGPVPVSCVPSSGSQFSVGTTPVTCSAVNSCGVEESCTFDVIVDASTLTVDIELSPWMAPRTITRCITFEFSDCSGGVQLTYGYDVTFVNGLALGTVLPVPTGTWECVTARDALHTLRSTAPDLSTTDWISYTATFMGDPASGGHWLTGGDLDGDGFVGAYDYVIFLQQYMCLVDPNTPCGAGPFAPCEEPTAYHADINGDGQVHVADLSFIQIAMFAASEPGCCGRSGGTGPGPIKEISISDLYRRGLGHLRFGDVNKDGKLSREDVAAFIELYGEADSVDPQGRPLQGAPAKRVRGGLPR